MIKELLLLLLLLHIEIVAGEKESTEFPRLSRLSVD